MGLQDILGRGLTVPFRRDRKADWASAEGEALVKSAVLQTLGTVGASDFTQGEVPWRTEFGSLLFLLRHQKNDIALRELAKVYVGDALRRFNPRIVVTNLLVERINDREHNKLLLKLTYNVIQENVPGNQVLLAGVQQDIEIGGVGALAA